jgi:hypothetical protein
MAYKKLEFMSPAEYQEQVGPGQYFVCLNPEETEHKYEALAILTTKSRPYPALMKNPGGYLFGRAVDYDEVENLSLERFTYEELKDEWDYVNLLELDLTGREDSRPIYAVKQQLQLKTFYQKLGLERLNRIPGCGDWTKKPNGTAMLGFAFPKRGWIERVSENYQTAIVNGRKDFVPPKLGSKKDGSQDLGCPFSAFWDNCRPFERPSRPFRMA